MNLSNNQISNIEKNAFSCLKELKGLVLSNNKIKYLDNDVFKLNKKLTLLDLSGNCIEEYTFCKHLINLRYLILSTTEKKIPWNELPRKFKISDASEITPESMELIRL